MAESFGERLKQRLIAEKIAYAAWFKGYTQEEIDAVKKAQGVKRLPRTFREYLEVMGHGGLQNLFIGEDWDYIALLDLKEEVLGLQDLAENFILPSDAFLFLSHQGHTFLYFCTDNQDDDPPVYKYMQSSEGLDQVADSLTAFFDQEIQTYKALRSGKFKRYKRK